MREIYNKFIAAASSGDVEEMDALLKTTDIKQFSKVDDKNVEYFGTKALAIALFNERMNAVDVLMQELPYVKNKLRDQGHKLSYEMMKQLIMCNKVISIDKMAQILSSGRSEKEKTNRTFSIKFTHLIAFAVQAKNEDALNHLLSDSKWRKCIDFRTVNIEYILYQALKNSTSQALIKILSGENLVPDYSYNVCNLISNAIDVNLLDVVSYVVYNTSYLDNLSIESINQKLGTKNGSHVIHLIERKNLVEKLDENLFSLNKKISPRVKL